MIAKGLTIHRQSISTATREGNEVAQRLLGLEPSGYFGTDKLVALVEQTPAKAQHVALAVVLGACESVTSKQTWRYPSSTDNDYFAQLAAWGYNLSDVEQIVTAGDAADAAEEASSASADLGEAS